MYSYTEYLLVHEIDIPTRADRFIRVSLLESSAYQLTQTDR